MTPITRSGRGKRWLLAGALALSAGSAACADVSVSYVKPEAFTDVPFNEHERDLLLKQLTEHFVKLGQQLPADAQLKVEVLDVDLAGRVLPRRTLEDIRVLDGRADWPHMKLRYTLEQPGRAPRSGESDLSNMMYQERMNRYFSSEALRYEKQMIDDWFDREIIHPKADKGAPVSPAG
jgi:hypothetical protein